MMQAAVYGRLGRDPVERVTKSGNAMVTASVAVNAARPGADEATVWISLTAFGRVAEALRRHAQGDLLAAMGTLTLSSYTDKDGNAKQSWQLTADAVMSAKTVRPTGGRKPDQKEAAAAAFRPFDGSAP